MSKEPRHSAGYWWVHPDKKERMDPFTTKPWTVFKMLKRFPDSIPRRVRGGQILWVLQGGQDGDETWDGGYVRFNFEGKPDALFNQEMHVAQRRHQIQQMKGQTV